MFASGIRRVPVRLRVAMHRTNAMVASTRVFPAFFAPASLTGHALNFLRGFLQKLRIDRPKQRQRKPHVRRVPIQPRQLAERTELPMLNRVGLSGQGQASFRRDVRAWSDLSAQERVPLAAIDMPQEYTQLQRARAFIFSDRAQHLLAPVAPARERLNLFVVQAGPRQRLRGIQLAKTQRALLRGHGLRKCFSTQFDVPLHDVEGWNFGSCGPCCVRGYTTIVVSTHAALQGVIHFVPLPGGHPRIESPHVNTSNGVVTFRT